jgi:transcriptional regulator with XRE-family HTH domain
MTRDAFGPSLRRKRLQTGITIQQIATSMKVDPSMLEGLERNDFDLWPEGVYARAYLRQYAEAIGADPEATIDEFCRWFPHGDRRMERIVREHAEIVGHELEWDDARGPAQERRGVEEDDTTAARTPAAGTLLTKIFRPLKKA